MLLPVIIEEEKGVGFSIIVPDVEGAVTSAPNEADIPARVQSVVETCIEFSEQGLPTPSAAAEVARSEEAKDGFVMFVDVDFSFLNKKTERINISVPSYLLHRIDGYAKQAGNNRSQYLVDCALRCAPQKTVSTGA